MVRAAALAALALATWLSLTPRPPQLEGLPQDSDKLAHFAMHFGVTCLLALGWRRRAILPVALGAALALEIGQLWVPGRSFSLADMIANLSGVATGLVFAALMTRRGEGRG